MGYDWTGMALWFVTKRPIPHIKTNLKSTTSYLAIHYGLGPFDELTFDVLQQRFAAVCAAIADAAGKKLTPAP